MGRSEADRSPEQILLIHITGTLNRGARLLHPWAHLVPWQWLSVVNLISLGPLSRAGYGVLPAVHGPNIAAFDLPAGTYPGYVAQSSQNHLKVDISGRSGAPGIMISVIIPVFNAESFVRQATTSALEQPEVAKVLLVDDGSPMQAPRFVHSFQGI